MSRVTAFAPATVANVAVGFDILGFAVEGIGDRVTAERIPQAGRVELAGVTGVAVDAPPERNTAVVAARALCADRSLDFGVRLRLAKEIPLGSGLGGSAASAVGAVVAVNALLPAPLTREELLPHALAGEAAASGAPHPDNVVPCLWGGLTATTPAPELRVLPIPVPDGVHCVLVRPHIEVRTREAREALPPSIPLSLHVAQSAQLARFLAACFNGDTALLRGALTDLVVEPHRAKLIPRFAEAQEAALDAGALGCSVSGSGPSLFAWTENAGTAGPVRRALTAVFDAAGTAHDSWISPVGGAGAAGAQCVS